MTSLLAAIDVGTNTIRLLVAAPSDDGLERRTDLSETVRLGRGVDAEGRLAADRIDAAAGIIARFADQARRDGASAITVTATSAVRDAANRDAFIAAVQQASGLTVQVIGGDREAALTSRGALLGRARRGAATVIDIGGGSTEVVATRDGSVIAARSYQLGSGRLTERCLISDPPTPAEIEAARGVASSILTDLPGELGAEAILTAGTAEALLRLTPRVVGDDRLTRAQLDTVLTDLLQRPAAATAALGVVDRDRARVLPGGIIVVQTLLERLHVDMMYCSRGGLREGVLLEQISTPNAGGA